MTPACAFLLLAYFLFFLVLQQRLPAGEVVLQWPFKWTTLTTYMQFTMIYAIIVEFRRGGVRLRDRDFWREYAILLAVSTPYFTFFSSFGYSKSLIAYLNPYYLDPLLQKWDLWLHFGSLPWSWFADRLGDGRAYTLNNIYFTLWYVTMLLYTMCQMIAPPSPGRTQFLSSFVMLWVIAGIVVATLCASVGPVYYADFFHDGYSAANLAYAERLYPPNVATGILDTRALLLGFYHNDHMVDWNGISAMPSLHTAVAMLLALHSYRYARRLSYVLIPFAAFIIVASVALGWHYALDTYVSALLLWAIWTFNRWQQRSK